LELGPPQQRAVLAALAVDAGRPVPLETLVDRIWGEAPPARARAALYTHITRIRRALEAAGRPGEQPVGLVRRAAGYVLEVEADRVDLHRFRRLIAAAADPRCSDANRAGLLAEALGLWRGTPLADVPGEWADRMREGWRQLYLDAVVPWARSELALGRPDRVIGQVRDLLASNPLVEPLVATLMRALAAVGRDAEALECYAVTRSRLVEELGTEPGAELQAVHQAILRGELPRTVAATIGPVSAQEGDREFDLCLSFAGEDRVYVEAVADVLKERRVRVFYDKYMAVELWGKELSEHLDKVYRRLSRYCVIFVSANYARKLWTTHERKSAQARAVTENEEYILPARFDDTEIPGLRPTVGYVDLRHILPEELAYLILQKLDIARSAENPQ
jgi:DNA-binding SARP family transcriptional activator